MISKTTKMKVLIAYDGSECADQAIEDLQRAGLPAEADAIIVSVEEVWLPPPPVSSLELVDQAIGVGDGTATRRSVEPEYHPVEAEGWARKAAERIEEFFPAWSVTATGVTGSPAGEILRIADDWGADLIVVGSHGRSGFGRLVFGSVSHQIIIHAGCTVRVARCDIRDSYGKERILIGVDGSLGAEAAINEVASRHFPAETEVRLVIVCDPLRPTLVGQLIPKVKKWVEEGNREEAEWAKDVVRQQAEKVKKAGFLTSYAVKEGDPRRVLVDEAEDWQATTVVVGARGLTAIDRFLLGSVSAAVAQRADCSVEIVR